VHPNSSGHPDQVTTSDIWIARRREISIFYDPVRGSGGRSWPLYELGNDHWDIRPFGELLTAVIPQHATIEDFEVEHDFRPSAGEPASHRYGSRNPVRFEFPAGASKAASSKFPIIKV